MLDDGVAKFADHPSVLLQLAFLQIIGLTGFPVVLRTTLVRIRRLVVCDGSQAWPTWLDLR